jgi:hypothetical protein
MDAEMPVLPLVFWMPMPSYGNHELLRGIADSTCWWV